MRVRLGTGLIVTAILAVTALAGPRAEVVSKAPNGFTVKQVARIEAPPQKVYDAAMAIARWWSPAHTYSGSAANLSIDPKPGGCWCETLPGGGVKHMELVFLSPGKQVRFTGGLGPLQSMAAAGSMSWTFAAADTATTFTLTYTAGGYTAAGFEAIAPVVDEVIAQQVVRLKRLAETGKAD
jgi:uncharacterized protein YndB with AHSA1/START domain